MNYLNTNQSKIWIIRWQFSLKNSEMWHYLSISEPMSTAIPFSSVSMSLRSDRASSCFAFSIYQETTRWLWNTHVGHQTHQDFITCGRCIRFTSVYITSTFSSADEGSERNSRAFDGGGWSTSPSFCLCSKWLPFLMKESSASIITSLHPFSQGQLHSQYQAVQVFLVIVQSSSRLQ